MIEACEAILDGYREGLEKGGEPFIVDLEIEGHQVVSAGDVVEPAPAELVQGDEVEYTLTLPGEGGETEVFFSDLSPEYVNFNAEYTS